MVFTQEVKAAAAEALKEMAAYEKQEVGLEEKPKHANSEAKKLKKSLQDVKGLEISRTKRRLTGWIALGREHSQVVILAGELIDSSGTMSGGGAKPRGGGMSSNVASDAAAKVQAGLHICRCTTSGGHRGASSSRGATGLCHEIRAAD